MSVTEARGIRVARDRAKNREQSLNVIPKWVNVIFHIMLIFGSLFCILPLVLVLSASFSDELAVAEFGYSMLPRNFTFAAYDMLFSKGSTVTTAYANTILATIAGTLLCVVMVGLYAYPLSRKRFRFSGFFTFFSFFTMLFGGGLVPFYILVRQILGLYNTIFALFLPSSFSAFWVIVMRTFYRTNVPEEVIESARIDGAGEWRTLIQIVLPLAVPGLATVALFSTIGLWNNFFNCLLFCDDPKYYNLQFFIYQTLTNITFLKEAAASMGAARGLQVNLAALPSETFRMAMAIVTIGPIVLAYPFFQRFFIKGLTIGAIKG